MSGGVCGLRNCDGDQKFDLGIGKNSQKVGGDVAPGEESYPGSPSPLLCFFASLPGGGIFVLGLVGEQKNPFFPLTSLQKHRQPTPRVVVSWVFGHVGLGPARQRQRQR